MSRNIVRHLRFSKSEYEAVSRKAAYLKMPKGRFIRKIAVQGNMKRYDLDELRKITRAFNYCGDSLGQIRKIAETEKSEYLAEIKNLQNRFLNISKVFEKEIKKLRPNVLI